MRTFILLSAIPGAGKSTWASQYAKDHPDVYIVSSDECRKEVTGAYQRFDQEKKVWELFRTRIHEYAAKGKNVTVIADAVNDTNDLRKYYAKDAKEFDKKILVFIQRPLAKVLKQNTQRQTEKWVPNDIIEMYDKKMQIPSDHVIALYDEYIVIKD